MLSIDLFVYFQAMSYDFMFVTTSLVFAWMYIAAHFGPKQSLLDMTPSMLLIHISFFPYSRLVTSMLEFNKNHFSL
jgi:hypothetical protein